LTTEVKVHCHIKAREPSYKGTMDYYQCTECGMIRPGLWWVGYAEGRLSGWVAGYKDAIMPQLHNLMNDIDEDSKGNDTLRQCR
jgi:hypothetical protein